MEKKFGGEVKPVATFEDIVWRDVPPALKDQAMWERNLGVMRMLYSIGTPIERIANDDAENIPKAYDVEGVRVEFLPHWGFYRVGEINLDVPASEEQLREDVVSAKYLQSRGLRARKNDY